MEVEGCEPGQELTTDVFAPGDYVDVVELPRAKDLPA